MHTRCNSFSYEHKTGFKGNLHIEGSNRLSFCMFGVGDRISNNLERTVSINEDLVIGTDTYVFKENLEDAASLFIN